MSTRPEPRGAAAWRSSTRIPFAVDSLPTVRHQLLAEISDHHIDADAGYDAALVLAELVTNALRHGSPLNDGGLSLAWDWGEERLHLHVSDGGARTEPTAQMAEPQATNGRGLAIVRALSVAWGVERARATTTVWASLAAPLEPSVPSAAPGRAS